VREGNAALDAGTLPPAEAAAVAALLARCDGVLGLLSFGRTRTAGSLPDEVQTLLDARAAARKGRNWAEADRLRDALAGMGWEVRDTPQGQTCKRN
jgi:cysteinyl-tRNA synthetase